MRLARNTNISWDDNKKEFLVKIQGACTPCSHHDEVALKHLPILIASSSNCSCGAKLTLKSHSFAFSDGELDFSALYQCAICTRKERTMARKLFSVIQSIWQDTNSIEFGPEGFKYAKQSVPKDGT